MIKLAETYFRLDMSLIEADRANLRDAFTQKMIYYTRDLFGQTPKFAVYIEDGSLRGWLVVAGSLTIAIGEYGSFRSGIDYAIQDAQLFSERVVEDIEDSGINDEDIIRVERRLGVPGQINRVLKRIDRLEEVGRDLSKTSYNNEIKDIQRRLKRIFMSIDNEMDAQLLEKNLPASIINSLPGRLPRPGDSSKVPLALRPEEWRERPKLLMLPDMSLNSGKSITHSSGNLYKLVTTPDGFQFVAKSCK